MHVVPTSNKNLAISSQSLTNEVHALYCGLRGPSGLFFLTLRSHALPPFPSHTAPAIYLLSASCTSQALLPQGLSIYCSCSLEHPNLPGNHSVFYSELNFTSEGSCRSPMTSCLLRVALASPPTLYLFFMVSITI